jgi:hypothetical protein
VLPGPASPARLGDDEMRELDLACLAQLVTPRTRVIGGCEPPLQFDIVRLTSNYVMCRVLKECRQPDVTLGER